MELKISRKTVSRVFEFLVEKWYVKSVGTNKKDFGKLSNKS